MDGQLSLDRKPWDKLPDETPRQYGAFTRWLAGNRVTKDIAELVGVTEVTIERWRAKYSWIDRAEAFDSEIPRAILEQAGNTVIGYRTVVQTDELTDYQRLIASWRAEFAQLVGNSSEDGIDLDKLDKLIKMRERLMAMGRTATGQPTSYKQELTKQPEEPSDKSTEPRTLVWHDAGANIISGQITRTTPQRED